MYLTTLAFLIGILVLQWLPALPHLIWLSLGFIPTFSSFLFSSKILKTISQFLMIVILGCVFGVLRIENISQWELPKNLEGKTLLATGVISSLPHIETGRIQFEFNLKNLNHEPQKSKIYLSWYKYPNISLNIGDVWQMQVRLKRPHGLVNPGGFDYEKWLFSREIRATGYVITGEYTKKLETHYLTHWIDRARQQLQEKITGNLKGEKTAGLITALIMGSQSGITQDQWKIMRATGTNHLMAIAGVHIAFISGFIYAFAYFLWRRSSYLMLWSPTPQAAGLFSLFSAIIYSALAGFALPTQRAIIMMSVFTLTLFLRRNLNPWNSFALAVLILLLLDPLSTLSISFWLSFGAVFAIIYGISHRLKPKSLWWKYGRIQWTITLGLIPLTTTLFQQTSLISLLANLIAVPAVGIFVLPLCFIGTLFLMVPGSIGHLCLLLASKIISIIWYFLNMLSQIKGAIWIQSMPNTLVLATTLVAILLLIAPNGLKGRWIGIFWLFPLIFYHPEKPNYGEIWLTLLDVGQGLSAIVQTQNHNLIFDTGPSMGDDDTGQRVIIPFAQSNGISKIDLLLISHGDNDHIGGAFSLIKTLPVHEIISSVPERFSFQNKKICQAGQRWIWDGVTFEVLYPTHEQLGQGNNSSCVLRVGNSKRKILLTGDIEKPAEKYILQHDITHLTADILIVPHHGSKTSSTLDFIHAINPNNVLFSTGYKNRFHFPNPMIVSRYRDIKATLFNTANQGAIFIHIAETGKMEISTARDDKRVWRDRP